MAAEHMGLGAEQPPKASELRVLNWKAKAPSGQESPFQQGQTFPGMGAWPSRAGPAALGAALCLAAVWAGSGQQCLVPALDAGLMC